jgi:hypothetical protein
MIEELEEVYSYLTEYKELCKKYGIEIYGCGCCGSPYLDDLKYIKIENICIEKNELFDKYELAFDFDFIDIDKRTKEYNKIIKELENFERFNGYEINLKILKLIIDKMKGK